MNPVNNCALSNELDTVDLHYLGIPAVVQRNLAVGALAEQALAQGEGHLANNGALVVETGTYTGRSPKDRFIVDSPEVHDSVAWGDVNKPLNPATFEALWEKALAYIVGHNERSEHDHSLYVTDGLAGAHRDFAKRFRVIGESAAQALFVRQLLVRPTTEELAHFDSAEDFASVNCSGSLSRASKTGDVSGKEACRKDNVGGFEVGSMGAPDAPADNSLGDACIFATSNSSISANAFEKNSRFDNGFADTDTYTVLALPNLQFDPAIDGTASGAVVALDFTGKRILIAGTKYSGEIKKAVFTVMNYCLPELGILPMHCSANCDPETGATAIFFGLSGTGKTTLSASPDRAIIGDDEHGWAPNGIFNFEGGCYAKCINLTSQSEPEIFNAIRFGALVENVVMDPATRELDFFDARLTDNTRVGYPIDYIPGAVESGTGAVPQVLIFLTADAFGVLPPIARLTPEAAMYHFVTGFTSKVAGTECGVTEPVPTFSSMFGEPFMPRPASVYANLLGERITAGDTSVYLVNTGWAGGAASEGVPRIPLRYTRAMVNAALSGQLADVPTRHDGIFNLEVPLAVPGVPEELLNPEVYWQVQGRTPEAYLEAACGLAHLFEENFASRHGDMENAIADAGPRAPR